MSEAKPYETDCPRCGATKIEGQRHCGNCGHDLYALEGERDGSVQAQGCEPPRGRKSIRLAMVLAIVFPGLGHLYAGRWERGLTIMTVFILTLLASVGVIILLGGSVVGLLCLPLVLIGGGLLFILFEVWQVLDAGGSAAAVDPGRS
jgi:hypothetical protein